MKITKEEVAYVAKLARLELDEAAMEKFCGQIDEILDYVDTLSSVDTTNVAPMTHAFSLTNALRPDGEEAVFDHDTALSNAPQKEDGSFVVPKVIT